MNNNLRPASSVDWSSRKILVVDDFSNFRNLLRKMLESFGATNIEASATGEDAIRKISAKKYDIILCDYNLGAGKDGQQVLEEVKHLGLVNYSTIFIMVTAENTMNRVMGAVEYQPDGYLIKPFTRELIKNRLEKLIAKKKTFAHIEKSIQNKDYESALSQCDEQIKNTPANVFECLRLKAELLSMSGEYEKAVALYNEALETHSIPWALFGLGRARYFMGDYPLARDIFQDLIGKNNTFMEAYDWLAKTFLKLREPEKAQQTLMTATQISPKVILRQRKLGEIAYRNNDYDTAKKSFKSAITLGKNSCFKSPSEYSCLAKVLSDTKAPEEALRVIHDSRNEFRDSVEATLQAAALEGIIYSSVNRMEDAGKAIEEASLLLNRLPDRVPAEIAMDMAKACFAVGDMEQGTKLMREVVKNNHEDEEILERVQDVFKDAQLMEEGKKVIELTRNEIIQLNNSGVRLVRENRLEEAIEYFDKAVASMPGNKVISANAAQALIMYMQKTGKKGELLLKTKKYLEQVKKIDPSYKNYQGIYSLYQKLIGRNDNDQRD